MFRRTYDEIVGLLINKILDADLARKILRASGWRSGEGTAGGGDLSGLIPPGGAPGDILWYHFPGGVDDPETWVPEWVKPLYLQRYEQGEREPYTRPWLGDARGVPLYTFAARNPDYTAGVAPTDDSRASNVPPVEDASRRQELLVWQDIPAGTFYYPYNVDWFVTKRELERTGKYFPRQLKLRCGWVGGSPDATLHFSFSATGTNPWGSLITVELNGGGPKNSGWIDFPESASGDVYLGLLLEAHAPISTLHMAPIEVLMRWAPRGALRPSDFTS